MTNSHFLPIVKNREFLTIVKKIYTLHMGKNKYNPPWLHAWSIAIVIAKSGASQLPWEFNLNTLSIN